MKLSFITDEATQSFEESIQLAKQCGLDGLELRSVQDTAIDRMDKETLKEWKNVLDREGLKVCSLASSFYKCEMSEEAIEPEMEKLARLCDAADILECETIRGFAFFAPESGPVAPKDLVPYFEKPTKYLKERGKKLYLEADPSVNTSNHGAIAKLLSLLDPDVYGAIYDPGNDIYDPLGEIPYPDGYKAVAAHLAHVHIKDAIVENGEPRCVKPGTGLVDYPGLLGALVADGYQGWLSLECHYRKDVVLTEEQMRTPQGSDFSRGGKEALIESAQALKEMLEDAIHGK